MFGSSFPCPLRTVTLTRTGIVLRSCVCVCVCAVEFFAGFWQLMFFRTNGIGFLTWIKAQTGPSYDKKFTGGEWNRSM